MAAGSFFSLHRELQPAGRWTLILRGISWIPGSFSKNLYKSMLIYQYSKVSSVELCYLFPDPPSSAAFLRLCVQSSSSPACKQSGLQLQYASYSRLPFVSAVGWGANARDGKWIVGTNCICLVGYLLLRPPWFIIYPPSDHQCCCFGAA